MRVTAVLVPATALAAGVLFATSATTAHGTDLRADRTLRLTELIARERDSVQALEREAERLRVQVQAQQQVAAARDSRVAAAQPPADLVAAAGLIAVTGPAVTVRLNDAPRRQGRPNLSSNPDDLVVHQQDVQAVVNALWAGGAEAMTLMGQRIIATSAVICVGNTLLLHGQVYSPPFFISAIGNPERLRASLDSSPGVTYYRTFVTRFGLGYDVTTERQARFPAYAGPLQLPAVVPAAARR